MVLITKLGAPSENLRRFATCLIAQESMKSQEISLVFQEPVSFDSQAMRRRIILLELTRKYSKYKSVGLVPLFNGISTFLGYSMPKLSL